MSRASLFSTHIQERYIMKSIRWKKLHQTATIPEQATVGSAAVDLKTLNDVTLRPGEKVKVLTGLSCEIENGLVGIIAPRSGLGSKGFVLANTIGVIDSDYRGEIIVALHNTSVLERTFMAGDKIAQMMFLECPQVAHIEVEELNQTSRGEGGFGSTGN